MFIKHTKVSTTIVLVYVDDIIVTDQNDEEINEVKRYLKAQFDIEDLGKWRRAAGIEIAHSSNSLRERAIYIPIPPIHLEHYFSYFLLISQLT